MEKKIKQTVYLHFFKLSKLSDSLHLEIINFFGSCVISLTKLRQMRKTSFKKYGSALNSVFNLFYHSLKGQKYK